MKISTKGRYALRLMIDLAMRDKGTYITIKSIAKSQGISEKYLEQIITGLSRAGYVQSVRGAQGGYRLSMRPEEYTVGMILRQVEGDLAPVYCATEGNIDCDRLGSCASSYVYQKIKEAVDGVVDQITLAELVEKQIAMDCSDNHIC